MTANDLITATLQDLGVLQPSEAPSADDAAVALRRLNRLIDGWKLQRLMIASITRSTWTITASDGSYTVGTGGDINIARPTIPNELIVRFIETSTDPDTEIPLFPLTDDAYARIPQKAVTALYPTGFWYNPTFGSSDTGLGTLELWPVPTSTTLQGVCYAPTPLGELATLSTDFYAPPGYRRLYETALAVELARVFNRTVTADMLDAAREASADVKRINIRLEDMHVDRALLSRRGGRSNIYTGSE